MKLFPPLLVCLWALAGATTGSAQWAVVDVAAIQQNLTNYSALVEQLSRQATQISNQVQQIKQYETQLKRLGDMASVKNLVGFSEFRLDLDLPSQIKSWKDNVARVDVSGHHKPASNGRFKTSHPRSRKPHFFSNTPHAYRLIWRLLEKKCSPAPVI